jgi:hypothetical protein
MLQSTKGGLRETVLKELMVIPTGFASSLMPVITVTPVAKQEKAQRSSWAEN